MCLTIVFIKYEIMLSVLESLWVSMCMCALARTCALYMQITYVCVNGRHRLTWDIFLNCSPPWILRQVCSLSLELTNLCCPLSSRNLVLCPPVWWLSHLLAWLSMCVGESKLWYLGTLQLNHLQPCFRYLNIYIYIYSWNMKKRLRYEFGKLLQDF